MIKQSLPAGEHFRQLGLGGMHDEKAVPTIGLAMIHVSDMGIRPDRPACCDFGWLVLLARWPGDPDWFPLWEVIRQRCRMGAERVFVGLGA